LKIREDLIMIRLSADRIRVIAEYFKKIIFQAKEFCVEEFLEIMLLLNILLGHLFVHNAWTSKEMAEMKFHLKNTLKILYPIAIFLLPGGLLLIPLVSGKKLFIKKKRTE
jgi:hypothetical protein